MTTKEVTKWQWDPSAPVTGAGVHDLLAAFKGEIGAALTGSLDVKMLLTAALNSCRKTPKLFECTQASMVSALMYSAQAGLLPDTPEQLCHLIPFKGQVVWMGGYRGFIKLAKDSGEISRMWSFPVYKGDRFDFELGSDPKIEHKPAVEDPDRVKDENLEYVYAVAEYRDGYKDFEVMTKQQVIAIQKKAPGGNSDAWKLQFAEMARKTVLKRLCKRLPMSPSLALAVDLDNKGVGEGKQAIHAIVQDVIGVDEKTPTANLADELVKKAGIKEEPDFEPPNPPDVGCVPEVPEPEVEPDPPEKPPEKQPEGRPVESFREIIEKYRAEFGLSESAYSDLVVSYGKRRLAGKSPGELEDSWKELMTKLGEASAPAEAKEKE